jgi:large subunit ribosomal protein L31e
MSSKPTGKTGRSAIADVVAREYTIHLHKRVCHDEWEWKE